MEEVYEHSFNNPLIANADSINYSYNCLTNIPRVKTVKKQF